ncbi:hypothetical protein LTR62_005089 [Meristemomyces frigidus]|uniref:Uncharacterized protein n=1 Tax=Meristemomyces frigidus TaxID=1508187 RepID=A0AAN7TPD2_9PEZI|nr:hypothetical protein LTR62_005089 [Meristemomyces frigidus]
MSPQPPPALLPILSPILRQRLQYMTPNTARGESWLPLLQWDPERAAKLPDIVERVQPEPHPVSGELELDEIRPAKYRRLDEETLQSRLEVEQYEILPIYVWCENDEHGQTGPGWKLSELRSLEDIEDGTEWFSTIGKANDAAEMAANTHILSVPTSSSNSQPNGNREHTTYAMSDGEDYDDGSYWAGYDATPGRTPAKGPSPAPPNTTTAHQQSNTRPRSQSELDYYNRYGNEFQPALDGHDPDEPDITDGAGGSTLTGVALATPSQSAAFAPPRIHTQSIPQQRSLFPPDQAVTKPHDSVVSLPQPRAISPTTSHGSVDRLEEAAEALSQPRVEGDTRALLGIKQHISTDIKSLFRLAKSAGMELREFEEVVGRELSVLGMFED